MDESGFCPAYGLRRAWAVISPTVRQRRSRRFGGGHHGRSRKPSAFFPNHQDIDAALADDIAKDFFEAQKRDIQPLLPRLSSCLGRLRFRQNGMQHRRIGVRAQF